MNPPQTSRGLRLSDMNAKQRRSGRAAALRLCGAAAALLVLAGAAGLAAGACGSSPPLDPDCARGSVIALGDSITFGAGLPRNASYPAQLSALLGTTVCNVGRNGDSANQGLHRLQRDALQFDPRVVVILFGTNDSGLFASEGKEAVPVSEYTNEMQQIVARVRRSGAAPVLLTLPPLNVPLLTSEHLHPENRAEYDAVIRQVAAAGGGAARGPRRGVRRGPFAPDRWHSPHGRGVGGHRAGRGRGRWPDGHDTGCGGGRHGDAMSGGRISGGRERLDWVR